MMGEFLAQLAELFI